MIPKGRSRWLFRDCPRRMTIRVEKELDEEEEALHCIDGDCYRPGAVAVAVAVADDHDDEDLLHS